MAFNDTSSIPLVSATQFNVSPQAIDDGSNVYGTVVNAGTGDWVLGSAIPEGRKLFVVVDTGALTSTPTGLKVALYGSATDANGSNGAVISGTETEWDTPAGDTVYTTTIDLGYVTDLTKYYSLGLSTNGGGSTSIIAGAIGFILEKHTQ